MPLFEEHWDDVALDQDTIPLEPNWEMYEALDRGGQLHILTVRDDGRLVGYVFWLVFQALHYKSLKIADNDMFFLLKPYRKGLTGYKMLREGEKILKELGVNKAFASVKIHKDVGKLFERLAWRPVERLYAKGINVNGNGSGRGCCRRNSRECG